jgi:hypothetical protein
MNISRRNFLGKSLKAMAVAALAPVIVPLIKTKEIAANPVPKDKFECNDYLQQIKIIDYTPGMKIPYESAVTPACIECMFFDKCEAGGKKFVQINESPKKTMAQWSRKLQARWYDSIKNNLLTKST